MAQNTYTQLGHIVAKHIQNRIDAADERVQAAAREMLAVRPSDMHEPKLPIMPPVPQAIMAVAAKEGESGLVKVCQSSQHYCRDEDYDASHRGQIAVTLRDDACPGALVAAIHAADAYADLFEATARQFRATCEPLIKEHFAAQQSSVHELVALVAETADTEDNHKDGNA